MNTQKLLVSLLCLGIGGAIAFVVGGMKKTHAHVTQTGPEAILPGATSLHADVAALSEKLEDGVTRLQDILDLTTLMLGTLRADRSESAEEIKLPLVADGATFGYLRMPEVQADGTRQWIFEVTIQALSRHAELADFTDLTITYSAVGETLASVSASSDTPLHRRVSTVRAIASRTYVTGGWFFADATASKTCPLVMTVDAEDERNPTWRSTTGEKAQGGDVLTPTNHGHVAGILFSL